MANGVALYATRPRWGPNTANWDELALGMMHLDIGIGLALYHQWFPGARRGLSIRDTSLPEVQELAADRIEARGTLTWARTSDDVMVGSEAYRLSARRERGRWHVLLLRLGGESAAECPEAAV